MGTSVLHIKTEVECRVYLFDEEKGIAKPGTYFNLEVRKGEQDLLFVSTADEFVICFKTYNVEEGDCDFRMSLDLSQFINVNSIVNGEEITTGVKDEFGVVYSQDGLQLLTCQNECLDEYHIQDGCKVIREGAFMGSDNLTVITLPDSLTYIGPSAFNSCENLTTITLPASLTHIGDWAFRWCKKLSVITLPDSLTHLGDYAFEGCRILSTNTLPINLTHIGEGAFSDTAIRDVVSHSPIFSCRDGCLIDQKYKMLLAYLSGKDTVSLPTSLTYIGAYAFFKCWKLTSITLPNSLTHIGDGAFRECENLTSITLPSGLTHIGEEVFFTCCKLTTITLPAKLTHIRDKLFFQCLNLTTINLPASLTHIGDEAFLQCQNLTTINMPVNLTHIGNRAFSSCRNLTSITLPASLTHIGNFAFSGCDSLSRIIIPTGKRTHFEGLLPKELHGMLTEININRNVEISIN